MEQEERTRQVPTSPTRRLVHELVRTRPGLSVTEVARLLDLSWTSAALHLDQLAGAGLVRSARVGRRRAFFSAGFAGDAPALLAESPCRRVAEAIHVTPGASIAEIAAGLEMSERAVYHHVQRLERAQLVRRAPGRQHRGVHPEPALVAALRGDPSP